MEPDRWRKVEQIYHAAREVEEGQRAAFIAKACAGDQALMQELRTLLAQPQATGSFLEAPALDVAAKALANEYSITHPERFCSVEDRGRVRRRVDISASLNHDVEMRTTVTLDDDVYQAAMHLAESSGERLGKVLSKLARRGLTPPQPPRKGSRRFPTFEVPADAPVIPASRIQRVIDEEGYF
ncbi:MAG TPA: hypothetical protein VMT86_12860 [Bryobacteraceae bacterium]|nr:hypothetical protein [Bryobacteraceae bacterium]